MGGTRVYSSTGTGEEKKCKGTLAITSDEKEGI